MKEKKQKTSKLFNYFLKTNESDYLLNFFRLKNKINKNNYSSKFCPNLKINKIDSFTNTQYNKVANNLTPFQKFLQSKEDEKELTNNKIKHQYLNLNQLELFTITKSNMKKFKQNNLLVNNISNISPKYYINIIKIYKSKNSKYHNIKKGFFDFEKNFKKEKRNNTDGSQSFSMIKISTNNINNNKKDYIENSKSNRKNKRYNSLNNNIDLHINNSILLSINKELKNNLKLFKLKKKNKKNDDYEEFINNIKKDINSSNKRNKKEINNNNAINDFLGFSNYNNNQNSLNLKHYSPLIKNNLDNSINKLKKNSKLISYIFSNNKFTYNKNKSRNNIIRNYDRKYNTHFF